VPALEKSPFPWSLLAVGVVGGLLAGLFGVGGGIVMVPLLMWWAKVDQRRAQATSLLAIAPAAVIGTSSYALEGVFPLLAGLIVAAGGVLGARVGALLLRKLSLGWLRWAFIAFVASMAVTVIFTIPHREVALEVSVAAGIGLFAVGFLMGTAAGLFGIGGGILAIPILMVMFGIGDLEAKGVSLIAMAPAAISGSISHLRHRVATARDGAWVAFGALIATPIGAAGAFLLPVQYANAVFGVFAIGIALTLAIRAVKNRH